MAESKRLAELLKYMDETREALAATVGDINPAFAPIRPSNDAWSAGETLAHLAVVEELVTKLASGAIERARAAGVGRETSEESVMGSLDRYRLTQVLKKINAPASLIPPREQSIEDSLASLTRSRARLRDLLSAAPELDLASVFGPHPMLGDLNMYQWALFVAQHEERHRRQIERTLKEVTERAAECAPIV